MSYGKQYYAQLKQLQAQVDETFNKLSGLQSALDRRVSQIYHRIEQLDDVDNEEGYASLRELKDTLSQRRAVKDEIRLMSAVYCLFKNHGASTDEYYDKALRGSCRIRNQLNAKMTIEEVFEALNV